MTPEDFYKALQEEGFNLSQQQKDQFQRYFELLVEWNEKINLTAITDKNDVYLKHFYDSLAPVLQGHIKNQNIRLSGVHFYHGRAEDFGQDKDFRAQFDVVTARAVARLQILSELTIPFLKVGGQLIALKAAAADEELAEAKNALNLLFAKPILNDNYHLPNGDGRHITIVAQKKETPNKYPRRAGMPNKKPL